MIGLVISVAVADALSGINLDVTDFSGKPQMAIIGLIAVIQGLVYLQRGFYRYVLAGERG